MFESVGGPVSSKSYTVLVANESPSIPLTGAIHFLTLDHGALRSRWATFVARPESLVNLGVFAVATDPQPLRQ